MQTTRHNGKIMHFADDAVRGFRLSAHYRAALYVFLARFH
jgi:hypothetical protein